MIDHLKTAAVAIVSSLIVAGAILFSLNKTDVKPAPAPLPKPTNDHPVVLPETVEVDQGDWVDIAADSLGPVTWLIPPPLAQSAKSGKTTLTFLGRTLGTHWIGANTVLEAKESTPVWVKVLVKKADPSPVDPIDPKPKPPDPKPDPKPPIPVTGFRVLFVKESQDKMTKEQINILSSTKITEYLNAKCAKDEKGRPSWRKWDVNVDTSNETETFKRLWDATKGQLTTLPAVVIVSDQRGDFFPLANMTEDEVLAMLKKYGG